MCKCALDPRRSQSFIKISGKLFWGKLPEGLSREENIKSSLWENSDFIPKGQHKWSVCLCCLHNHVSQGVVTPASMLTTAVLFPFL